MIELRHIIRQENLRILVESAKRKGMSQKAYAMQILRHKDDKYLSQLLQSLEKRGSRPMGDDTARDIEEKENLSSGYMSIRHNHAVNMVANQSKPNDKEHHANARFVKSINTVIGSLATAMIENIPAVAPSVADHLQEAVRAYPELANDILIRVILDIAEQNRHSKQTPRTRRRGTAAQKAN